MKLELHKVYIAFALCQVFTMARPTADDEDDDGASDRVHEESSVIVASSHGAGGQLDASDCHTLLDSVILDCLAAFEVQLVRYRAVSEMEQHSMLGTLCYEHDNSLQCLHMALVRCPPEDFHLRLIELRIGYLRPQMGKLCQDAPAPRARGSVAPTSHSTSTARRPTPRSTTSTTLTVSHSQSRDMQERGRTTQFVTKMTPTEKPSTRSSVHAHQGDAVTIRLQTGSDSLGGEDKRQRAPTYQPSLSSASLSPKVLPGDTGDSGEKSVRTNNSVVVSKNPDLGIENSLPGIICQTIDGQLNKECMQKLHGPSSGCDVRKPTLTLICVLFLMVLL